MTDTERAAWAAFDAAILSDAQAAGLMDGEWMPTQVGAVALAYGPAKVTANGDGTWRYTWPQEGASDA